MDPLPPAGAPVPIPLARLPVPPAPRPGDAGVRVRYPLDAATWVWVPGVPQGRRSVARFAVDFVLAEAAEVAFDVTADQRYRLACDGIEVSRGPDRSELGGWSFCRLSGRLAAGPHRLEATCWWLPEGERPFAQVTAMPAFAVAGLGDAAALVSTGVAPWRCREIGGWSPLPKDKALSYHVIGAGFRVDGGAPAGGWVEPAVVARGRDDRTGMVSTPWRLEPSPLPEQERALHASGSVRLVAAGDGKRMGPETGPQGLGGIARGEPVTIGADAVVQVLWDFRDYVCGHARLVLSGGAGAEVEVEWAESLHDAEPLHAHVPKGDRAACAGKHWLGFGDVFAHPGGRLVHESPWWRSGRWLRLVVRTAAEPLVIEDARPLRTGHPFRRGWAFEADRDLGGVLALCESGLRNCVHETFVDCPYYEQMQYVGDTRVQALAWLAATGDPRPVRRALELFDRSRWVNGFVAERCPTGELQMSSTYSLVQPHLLRDFAWWADDAAAVRALLPGTRAALEHAVACLDADGLPTLLPGWNFVDWVAREDWAWGVPGGDSRAAVAPVLLHLPLALDAAARVEDVLGDADVARRWRRIGGEVMAAIVGRYLDPARGILADDPGRTRYSEHAQALALDCSFLPEGLRPALLDALERPAPDLARASVYFSHHVHEALLRAGRVEAFLARLGFWEDLVARGFVATIEAPEPSRSDCHGWGAHPLYHALASLAGIRPGSPGFATVRVAPRLGPLREVRAVVPHPRGRVEVHLRRSGDALVAEVASPVAGTLAWRGGEQAFGPGRARLEAGGLGG